MESKSVFRIFFVKTCVGKDRKQGDEAARNKNMGG